MKIITLVEDTPGGNGCEFEHGLSLYVETHKHKLVVDTGATDMFIRNADRLGVDLKQVDTLILSHGHYDHAGGIIPFVKINSEAKIYMRKTAVDDYYHGERYIGIDKKIKELKQVVYTDNYLKLDEELQLFSDITGRRLWSEGNLSLTKRLDNQMVSDSFDHEQCLVISGKDKKILISGCAHNGILNILDKYRELFNSLPDIVITGFHLNKKTAYTNEEIADIKKIATELKKPDIVFYSGHCTGKTSFDIMKGIMGNSLCEIHSGDVLICDNEPI